MRWLPWIFGGLLIGAAVTFSRPLWAKTVEGLQLERSLAPLFDAAESKYGLPRGLLSRVAYQESAFREDIVSGVKRSSAGATGIMQFMPATADELGVKLDDGKAGDDIDGAGRYLAQLYRKYGSWSLALAAYNWGPGNLDRKGIDKAPTETVKYYTSITHDLGLA